MFRLTHAVVSFGSFPPGQSEEAMMILPSGREMGVSPKLVITANLEPL